MRLGVLGIAVWAVSLVIFAGAVARSDEVVLKTGERHRGKIIEETEREVRVLVTRSGIEAELTFDKKNVAQVIRSKLPIDLYLERRVELDERSATAQDRLAAWCRQNGLAERARAHALAAYRIEATAPRRQTLRDLGLVETGEGGWASAAELLAREGKVRVGGEVVSKAEAERRREVSYALTRRNRAQARLRVLERTLERLRRKRADLITEQQALTATGERLSSTVRALDAEVGRLAEELEPLRTDLDYYTRLKKEQRASGYYSPRTYAAQEAAKRAYGRHIRALREARGRLHVASRDLAKVTSRLRALARLVPHNAEELGRAEAERAEQRRRLAAAEARRAVAEGASEGVERGVERGASLLIDTLKQAVVLLVVERPGGIATGSGFLVSAKGHLVTNAHVVERGRSIRAVWDPSAARDPVAMRVVELRFDPSTNDDLALLLPVRADRRSGYAPLPLARAAVQGTTVYAAGFPLAGAVQAMLHVSASDLVVTKGILSSLRRSPSGLVEMLQTDASIASGSSGGPLVNDRGEVLGVSTFAVTPEAVNRARAGGGGGGVVGSSSAFAIPADRIRKHFGLQISGR